MRLIVHFLLLLSIFWVLTASTCDRDCRDSAGGYDFIIPVELTPQVDTFRVGDTIKISSAFSNTVFERNREQEYFLDSFVFFPITNLFKTDTSVSIRNAISYFDYIVTEEFDYAITSFNDGSQSLTGQYNYDGSQYRLDFKLVPNVKGNFLIQHGNSPELLGQSFLGYCGLNSIEGVTVLNNNAENNIYLLEDSPDPYFNEWTLEKPMKRFYDLGGYAFVVVN